MIYPKWYYCKSGDSDRDWILNMFHFIPVEHQQKIADRYEKIFRVGKGRKFANKFLHRIARRFRRTY